MAKKYDVVAVSKYNDSNGNEKTKYTNIGAVFTTYKGGFCIKIESVPVGWDGWAQLYEPKPREDRQHQKPGESVPAKEYESDFNDSIPF